MFVVLRQYVNEKKSRELSIYINAYMRRKRNYIEIEVMHLRNEKEKSREKINNVCLAVCHHLVLFCFIFSFYFVLFLVYGRNMFGVAIVRINVMSE